MVSYSSILWLALAASTVYKVITWTLNRWAYQRQRDSLGCHEPQGKYPHKDPILGLDLLFQGEKQRANSTYLQTHQQLFQELGKTHEIIFAGHRMIRTMDVKNIQAVLGTDQRYFGLEPLRTGLAEPLFGRGINTTDGEYWQYCRSLVKPTFSRVDVYDIRILESHFQDLRALLPSDGSTVDLQPLFSRLFLDTKTGLLFGESARTLSLKPDPAGEQFVTDFDYALKGLGTRVRLGPLKFLHQDRAWYQAISRVHIFIQKHIDRAFETEQEGQLGSRDLRAELATLGTEPPSFEALRLVRYLQWVINEAHRMWPVSSGIPRTALVDATIPTGGGPDGNSPILIKKGDFVMCEQYLIHHNAESWGLDHDRYRPERWDGARPLWNFGPFGGGPRTCPAQHMVSTEVSYVVVRLLQEFSNIEARDDKPWTEMWLIDMCNKHGCQVALSPRQT